MSSLTFEIEVLSALQKSIRESFFPFWHIYSFFIQNEGGLFLANNIHFLIICSIDLFHAVNVAKKRVILKITTTLLFTTKTKKRQVSFQDISHIFDQQII